MCFLILRDSLICSIFLKLFIDNKNEPCEVEFKHFIKYSPIHLLGFLSILAKYLVGYQKV
jgi:hypothetical protein